MFGHIFHKKVTQFNLYSPVTGKVYDISSTPDEVFAQKMLGDGFAVAPNDGNIYAPLDGKIVSLFPTKHAIGVETATGVQILIHMGINTVELKGIPFEIFVKEGAQVAHGTKIASVNLDYLKAHNIHNDIIVVFTNMDKIKEISISDYGKTSASEQIGTYTINDQ